LGERACGFDVLWPRAFGAGGFGRLLILG